jgi:hypothetical protein
MVGEWPATFVARRLGDRAAESAVSLILGL